MTINLPNADPLQIISCKASNTHVVARKHNSKFAHHSPIIFTSQSYFLSPIPFYRGLEWYIGRNLGLCCSMFASACAVALCTVVQPYGTFLSLSWRYRKLHRAHCRLRPEQTCRQSRLKRWTQRNILQQTINLNALS